MRRAVLFGAALAGLTPVAACQADPDSSADAGGGGHGGATGGAPVPPAYPSAPEPYGCPPEPDAGPDGDPPLSGPCCQNIECYEPADDGPCVDPKSTPPGQQGTREDEVAGLLGHEGLGSGECLCGVDGPYDAESAHAFTEEPGRCCYAISINWCTGRPLVIDAVARLAPLVARADWT